jgi:hypothetical protein
MLLSLRRLLLFAVLLAFPLSALAQFNASVQGTVTDPSGAVIPNATVTVTNQATLVGRSTQTSSNGFYNVTALPPGTYTVQVKVSGFETSTSTGVVVDAEQPRGLNVQMRTGTASETVQVTENTAPLQTENANVQGEITSRQVQDLPSYGRDPYSDLRLAPGVFGTGALSSGGGTATLPNTTGPGASNLGIFQTENQIPISANGQRVSSNNYMIDGVSVNSQTWGGAAVVTPNMDAVQEMSVTANTYNAQDSRNSGAIVRVVTKSGTNRFHGDGWFQYQDPNFNSFNKYGGPVVGEPTVRVDNNWKQFGGSIGGPILKDKLFFFFSYEGLRSFSNSFSVPTWIETSQYRSMIGNLFPGSFADQVINSPGMAPRVNAVLSPSCQIFLAASWPCQVVGNGIDIGSPTGGAGSYVSNVAGGGLDGIPDLQYVQLIQPNTASPNQYNGRVDYHWGQQLFSASGFLTKSFLIIPDGYSRPADDVRYKPTNEALMLSWVSTITPTLLNEARFNITRWAYNELTSAITNWGIPGVDAEQFPTGFRVQWGQPGNNSGTPAIFAENTYEVSDFVTKVWGSHTLKFGGQYDWEQNNDVPVGQIRPQYAFSFWNLVNSAPLFEAVTADPVTGQLTTGPSHFRTHYYAAFVQDDWKVKPNFTVNLGLRYEFFSPLSEVNGLTTNFFLGPNYATGLTDASVQPVSQYYKPDRNNFAPRIGFAWSPQKYGNNMVIRGGFGVAYDRIPEALLIPSRSNPPYQAQFGFCCGGADNPFVGGLIVLGTSNSIYGYPVSPLLAGQFPLGPNNLPTGAGQAVTIYGTPQNMPNPLHVCLLAGGRTAAAGELRVDDGVPGQRNAQGDANPEPELCVQQHQPCNPKRLHHRARHQRQLQCAAGAIESPLLAWGSVAGELSLVEEPGRVVVWRPGIRHQPDISFQPKIRIWAFGLRCHPLRECVRHLAASVHGAKGSRGHAAGRISAQRNLHLQQRPAVDAGAIRLLLAAAGKLHQPDAADGGVGSADLQHLELCTHHAGRELPGRGRGLLRVSCGQHAAGDWTQQLPRTGIQVRGHEHPEELPAGYRRVAGGIAHPVTHECLQRVQHSEPVAV